MNTKRPSSRTVPHDDHFVHSDRTCRVYGGIAMAGIVVFTGICLAVQVLRTDLNWFIAQMSLYTLGPWGAWVQAAFFAPAPGLAALGCGWYRTFHRRAWSNIAPVLFIAAAVSLCFTAAFLTDTTPSPVTLHGAIHQWSAFATFVFATTGMVLQSWRFRFAPKWRKHFPDAFAIAVITIVYFWIYALFHPIPRGLGEKIVIGLVLLWVWRAAWWLMHDVSLRCDD